MGVSREECGGAPPPPIRDELWLSNITCTVEPQYSDPRYNDISGKMMNILCPCKSYSKWCGTEPRYNDLRYNDISDITMRIQRTEGKIFPDNLVPGVFVPYCAGLQNERLSKVPSQDRY